MCGGGGVPRIAHVIGLAQPPLRERQMNYEAVKGGRYARAVDAM